MPRCSLAWLMWAACSTLATAGEPTLLRLTEDGYFKQRPAWSADGARLIFARHAREKIWLYELHLAARTERRLTEREAPEYDAVWSPAGDRLAFSHVSMSGTQGDVDVYLLQLDTGELTPWAVNPDGLSHQESPAWSPDGERLAFTSTAPGNQEIFLAAADGSGRTQLTHHVGLDAHPAWSPDGKHIAFSTDRWGGLELAVMDADGGQVRRLTESRGLDDYPAWSPDGSRLAFVSNRDGNFEIYAMPAAGGEAVNLSQSAAVDTFPAWSPDGRYLSFVSDRDRQFDIYAWEWAAEDRP